MITMIVVGMASVWCATVLILFVAAMGMIWRGDGNRDEGRVGGGDE
jgi:hypothetical protein